MTPTTPTGQWLLERRHDGDGWNIEMASDSDILAIEQEARAMERERLRDKAEGIAAPGFAVSPEWRRVLDRLLAEPDR